MKITACKVNHIENPIGYMFRNLTFSWIVEDGRAKLSRIEIMDDSEQCLLDSGWAEMDETGTRLQFSLHPRTRYYWRVSVMDEAENVTCGNICYFETGKMDEKWQAKGIISNANSKRCPVFVKKLKFDSEKKVRSARWYITALGVYEAYINGEKISNSYLTPGFHAYDLWNQVQTYDVTPHLRKTNKNNQEYELQIFVGDGWYKSRIGFKNEQDGFYGNDYRAIAELHIVYEDGSHCIINTDQTWQVYRSNVTFTGIYDGEHRDDTLPEQLEEPVILLSADEDEKWKKKLCDNLSISIKRHEEFHPQIVKTDGDELVLDIGQNLAGTFELRVNEEYGRQIRLQAGEVLQDGKFYRDNLRTAKAEYIYKSDGKEHIVRPYFTFYGFRYIKLEGLEHFSQEDLTVYALYSDFQQKGKMLTGNSKINQLLSNVEWGMKSNFLDMPTDCPQRDERMGWTGDAQVFSETALLMADVYSFYRKYLYDMELEQKKSDGMVSDVIPAVRINTCAAVWGDATTIIPWNMYLYSGDASILQEHYESMKSWISYIQRIDGDHCGWRENRQWGDWLALDGQADPTSKRGGTDVGFIADVYYRYSVLLTAKVSKVLGMHEEDKYEALAEKILTRIRRDYFSKEGDCCIRTQTAMLLTIQHALGNRENAVHTLVELLEKNDWKLQTGFVGTPLLCPILCEAGYEDIADKILLNEEYPGWLYEVNLGATTIWERWNSLDENGKISSTGMNSLNHYAYGSIVAYLWKYLAGLQIDENSPGFKAVKIHPHICRKIQKMDVIYPAPVGDYKIFWEIENNDYVHFKVTVPQGGKAYIKLPEDREHRQVELEGGKIEFTYEMVQ